MYYFSNIRQYEGSSVTTSDMKTLFSKAKKKFGIISFNNTFPESDNKFNKI